MKIVIEGVYQAPTWETVQKLISETLKSDGVITRIARRDGKCDYRGLATYDLSFRSNGHHTNVELEIR